MKTLQLILPLPPSINHYNRVGTIGGKNVPVKAHTYTSKAGKQFVRDVKQIVLAAGCPTFGNSKVAVKIDVHLGSRSGDHHNREKPMLDALQEANVFDDDKQVIDLRVVRCHPVKDGRCEVTIWRIE
jgi:crossover junction endodeoxyribonuclease RusA